LMELVLGGLGDHHDHAVGVMAGPRAGPARWAGVAVPYRRDGDAGLGARPPLLDAAQDLHGPRAVQAAEHQVDEPGTTLPARSDPGVLVLVEQPLHPGPG